MFSGIVEEMGRVKARKGSTLFFEANKALEGVKVGDSISVNGACLTVTSIKGKVFSVDITPETVRRTNLGALSEGDMVDLERAMVYGGPVGGHLVQGHVDATGRVRSITPEGDSLVFRFEARPKIMKYVVEKGFIAVDGISLTVVERDTSSFSVSVIPYTRHNTVLGLRKPGERVNIEVDILAKYVERLLKGDEAGEARAER